MLAFGKHVLHLKLSPKPLNPFRSYVTLGHVLTRDFDPPASVPAYRDDDDSETPRFAAPVDFDLVRIFPDQGFSNHPQDPGYVHACTCFGSL